MTVKSEPDWSCTFFALIWLFVFTKADNFDWFGINIDGLQQFVYQFSIVFSSVFGRWVVWLWCTVYDGIFKSVFSVLVFVFCSVATSLMASFNVNLGLMGASLCLGSPMLGKDSLCSTRVSQTMFWTCLQIQSFLRFLILFVGLVGLTLVWP